MIKKLMVLVGLTAVLFCGCGKEETVVKTKTIDPIVQKAIDSANELEDMVYGYYIVEACKEIYGDSFDVTKAIETEEGCIYEDKFVSWEEFGEVTYSLMFN